MLLCRALVLATVFVTISDGRAYAQQPSARHGLTGGIIGGGGQNIPDRCVPVSLRQDCPASGIIDIHAGWMFRSGLAAVGRLAILGGASGYFPDGAVLGGGVRYWPTSRRLWLSGGGGLGHLDSDD